MKRQNDQVTRDKGQHHARLQWLLAALMVIAGLGSVNAIAAPSPSDSLAQTIDNPACFHDHLHAAEQLNRDRRPRYARLSDGQSRAVSDRMIESEAMALLSSSLIPAMDFDAQALPYLQAGVNVVCGDFVSMSEAPPFRRHFKAGAPRLSDFSQPKDMALEHQLRREFRRNGYDGLHRELKRQLARLDREPRFNCLLHHVLSSMAHIAVLAPQYNEQALALGLPSPDFISTGLIDSHLMVLGDTLRIDRMAAPIQANDVPILCQDVPPIPVDS